MVHSKTTRRATKAARPDDLDKMIARWTAKNPEFPQLVQEALGRRRLMRSLAVERERRQISQQAVAQRMQTSQPAVARIESGEADVRLSTIDRYAAAVGKRVQYTIAPARRARRAGSSR